MVLLVPCQGINFWSDPDHHTETTVNLTHHNQVDSAFFSLTTRKGRHFFRDPAGQYFFSLGLNHISDASITNYPKVEELAGDKSRRARIKHDLQIWGYNTCGYGCPPELEHEMPFLVSLRFLSNGHYLPTGQFGFDDVFSSEFKTRCEEMIESACQRYRKNKNLIGYYWTDTPRWDILKARRHHGQDWVSYLRNLEAETPGKRRYVEFLERKYQTIESFNDTYGVHHLSFKNLPAARFDHLDLDDPQILADDYEFLAIVAEELYGYLYKSFKKCDAHHLILGDKYLQGDHPDEVLQIARKYVDIISIQPGPSFGPGPGPGLDEIHFSKQTFDHIFDLTGRPIMICDHQISFNTEEHPVTLWHQFPDAKTALEVQKEFIRSAIRQPYIIGYQRCQYFDRYDKSRGLLKQGLVSEKGEHHLPFSQELDNFHEEIMSMILN